MEREKHIKSVCCLDTFQCDRLISGNCRVKWEFVMMIVGAGIICFKLFLMQEWYCGNFNGTLMWKAKICCICNTMNIRIPFTTRLQKLIWKIIYFVEQEEVIWCSDSFLQCKKMFGLQAKHILKIWTSN